MSGGLIQYMGAVTKTVTPGNTLKARAHVGTKPWFIATKKDMLMAAEGMPPGIREAFIAKVEREMSDDTNP